METKFTKGPWSIALDSVVTRLFGYGGILIAELRLRRNAKADAALIAASPDLYAKLALALGVIDAAGIVWVGHDAAVAALAKARGEVA